MALNYQNFNYQTQTPPKKVNQFAPVGKAVDAGLGKFGNALLNTGEILSTNPFGGLGKSFGGNSGTQTSTPTGVPSFNLGAPQPKIQPVVPGAQPIKETVKTVYQPAPTENLAIQSQPVGSQMTLPGGQSVTVDASGNIIGGLPSAPAPTSFGQGEVTQDGYVPSSALSGNTSYSDILAKRRGYEKNYEDALLEATRITAAGNRAAENARWEGETNSYAQGQSERIGRMASLDSMAATSRADAYGKLLGINKDDIATALAGVDSTSAIQTSPAGDVFAQVRNPQTGETELISYGNIYNGTFAGVPQNGQGGGQQQFGQQSSVGVPTAIQSALGQIGNKQYIDLGSLSAGQLPMAQAYSTQSGIPLLKADDASKVKEADSAFSAASTLLSSIEGLYRNVITAESASGVPAQFLKRKLGTMFKTDADATVYLSTVKSFTSLLTRAAGEKGNLSDADKEALTNAIPTFSDTVEIADKKMVTLKNLFQATRDGVINSYLGSKAVSQGNSGGRVVQTKAGAINTDW